MAMIPKTSQDTVTLLAATTPAAGAVNTAGSKVYLPRPQNALVLILDVTAAATDAADTLDVTVETLIDGDWIDVCSFTQCLGNGGAKRHIAKIVAGVAEAMFADGALAAGSIKNLFGDAWRVAYVQADADTDAAFTFNVTATPM